MVDESGCSAAPSRSRGSLQQQRRQHQPAAAPAATARGSAGGRGAGCTVGVSWNNFQQPRWAAHDEPGIQKTVEAGGGTYIGADANLVSEQQLTDIDTMIAKGAKVLIILAQDNKAILPALKKAEDAGIPVIAYDRLIEDPSVLYITFDNVVVGQAEAAAIIEQGPEGQLRPDQGRPGRRERHDVPAAGLGQGRPEGQGRLRRHQDHRTGRRHLHRRVEDREGPGEHGGDHRQGRRRGTKIDAILAENDSTALGVVGALTAKNYGFPPLSGQDGDPANLNNVALGKQYVDVWKNANELGKAAGAAALQLCNGSKMADVKMPDGVIDPAVAPAAGLTAQAFTTPGGTTVKSFILKPTPLTADNLQLAIDGGQITKADLCKGVDAAKAPPACK